MTHITPITQLHIEYQAVMRTHQLYRHADKGKAPLEGADLKLKIRSFETGFALSCLSLGLYQFVWYYRLNDELKRVGTVKGDIVLADSRPSRSLLALLVGVVVVVPALASVYGFCNRIRRAEAVTGVATDKQIKPTLAFLLFFPGGILIVPVVIYYWYVTKHQNALLATSGLTAPAGGHIDERLDNAPTNGADGASRPARPTVSRGVKRAEELTSPTFRVVALGPSGSGKTVFLASMFHRLNFTTANRAYKLEADAEQLVALGRIYDELSDTATQSWPAGTDHTLREFVFDCVASSQNGERRPILRLSYLDYRGGLLTEGAEPGSTALVDLEHRVQTAHALLAVIDGFRLRQLLLHEPAGNAYFERKVRPMFALMERATCPIHFVVTKWDLVRGIGEDTHLDDTRSLQQVRLRLARDALMEYEHISGIVGKNNAQIVRLIPVSAVGSTFGTLDADGNLIKRADGRLAPMNVEVPLCAVLPDVFAQVEHRLDDPIKAAILSEKRDRQHQQALRVAAGALAAVMGGLGGFGIGAPAVTVAANELLGLFVGWMGGTTGETVTPSAARGKKSDARLAEAQLLRTTVMHDFKRTVEAMERSIPDSVLSAPR